MTDVSGERLGAQRGDLAELSTGELLRALVHHGERFVRDAVALARVELRQDAARAGVGLGVLAVGGVLALGGFLVLCFTAVYLLALVVPLWVSGLVIGVALVSVGGLLAWGGTSELRKSAHEARKLGTDLRGESWFDRKIQGNA